MEAEEMMDNLVTAWEQEQLMQKDLAEARDVGLINDWAYYRLGGQ